MGRDAERLMPTRQYRQRGTALPDDGYSPRSEDSNCRERSVRNVATACKPRRPFTIFIKETAAAGPQRMLSDDLQCSAIVKL